MRTEILKVAKVLRISDPKFKLVRRIKHLRSLQIDGSAEPEEKDRRARSIAYIMITCHARLLLMPYIFQVPAVITAAFVNVIWKFSLFPLFRDVDGARSDQ